jgi:hypothetical protein
LIVVSHDRYLLERVTDQQYAILDGRLRHLPGGIDEYLRLAAPKISPGKPTQQSPRPPTTSAAPQAISGAQRRAAEKELAATDRQLARLADRIATKHTELAEHDQSDHIGITRLTAELRALEDEVATVEGLTIVGRGSGLDARGAPAAEPPPPTIANAAWGPESSVPKPARIGAFAWIWLSFLVLIFLGQGVNWLGGNMLAWYDYRAGTPTTATIDRCVSHTSRSGTYETCEGTWSVGGLSQTGPIKGIGNAYAGSQVDVHVRGSTAYVASWGSPDPVTMFLGFAALATALVLLWSLWRKHKTGNWPLSGGRFKFFGQSGPPNPTYPA